MSGGVPITVLGGEGPQEIGPEWGVRFCGLCKERPKRLHREFLSLIICTRCGKHSPISSVFEYTLECWNEAQK